MEKEVEEEEEKGKKKQKVRFLFFVLDEWEGVGMLPFFFQPSSVVYSMMRYVEKKRRKKFVPTYLPTYLTN